jgi:hypothetical protein
MHHHERYYQRLLSRPSYLMACFFTNASPIHKFGGLFASLDSNYQPHVIPHVNTTLPRLLNPPRSSEADLKRHNPATFITVHPSWIRNFVLAFNTTKTLSSNIELIFNYLTFHSCRATTQNHWTSVAHKDGFCSMGYWHAGGVLLV